MTVSSPPAQQTASATRSFSPVEAGGQLVVTIAVDGYGGIGQLRETFPDDFTFESSPEGTGSGQTVTFNLVGDTSVSYTLTAPTTSGIKSGFLGTLAPAQGDGVTVGGPSSVTVLSPPAQQTASATRSFSPVEAGGQLVVTIAVDGYGGIGQLRETFPDDFTFESSPEGTGSGQTVTFNLVGDTSVSYTLTAPTTSGIKSGFLGTLAPAQGDGVTVGGPSSVTVLSPPAQQTASATRSFSPSEVASGGTLTVRITVAGYGGIGQLTEEFPDDFTFESSPEGTGSGQTVTFNLVGDTSVSYTLTAPTTTRTRSISGFSGTLEPAVAEGVTVGGPSSVTVRVPSTPPPSNGNGGAGNRAPVFTGGITHERSIAEGEAPGTSVGEPIAATDPDNDSIIYSLSGADAGSFAIDPNTGQITVGAGTELDYETQNTYAVVVTATDPSRATADATVTISVTVVAVTTPDGLSRSLPADPVAPDDEFTVTINNVGLPDGFGSVVETLPAGFSYVEDSAASTDANAIIDAAVDGQTVTFTLVGVDSFTYTVTASTTAGFL